MAQRINPEEAANIMSAADLTPLIPYPGYDAPWLCKCEKCGREVSPRFHGVKGEGKGCKYCSGNAVVPADAIEEMKAKNLLPLVDFPGASKPWLSECIVCGAQGKPRLADIRMGNSGCIKCGNLVGAKKRKLSASPTRKGQRKDFSQVLLVMKAANLEPLEPYVTSNTKWKCKCLNCGEIVTPKYHSVVSGRSGCVSCSRADRIGKYRLDDSTAIAIMKGKNLEPLEPYPGAMKPWKCKCLDCGNVIKPTYAHVQQGRKGCRYCGIKKNSERVRVSETKPSLSTTHPDLAKQAVNWNPDKITSGSHKILSWKCELGHQWDAQVKSRALSGNNCPTCSGHVVLAGFNDLKTANPSLANEAYGWDPSTVTPFSGKKVSWKCSSGHITEVRIASRSGGIGCPVCSGHKVLQGFNDLITSHPELVSEIDGWDPTIITKGHDKKLSWVCKFGHKWKANVYTRTGKDKTGCPVCSGIKVLPGFNDLKTLFPEIAIQALGWDPTIISAGNNKKFLWKCVKGHEWKMSVDQRTGRGIGCSVCSNRQVLIGYNDLATTHPDIARQAVGWDPTSITGGVDKKLLWQCNLGHQWKVAVDLRTRAGNGCPYCAGKKVLTGFNDLQTRFPEIAKEADGWDPSKVNSGAHRKLSWKCPLGHSYSADVGVRTGGSKSACPICAGKQVLAGFNDLKSKYPEIAEQAYGWDPEKISSGSSKKLIWKCSENHIWKTVVSDRTGNHKSGCPTCSRYGFDPNKDGYLYFVSHQDWEMLQIGITNVPDDRLKDHKKLGWEVLELRGPMDGHLTQQWETAILRMLKKKGADLSNENIAGKFDGYSEAWTKATFPVQSIKELMRLTDEFEEGLGKGRRVE